MKNIKIGTKIFVGFACVFILLLAIAVTSIITSLRTGSNIDDIKIYGDLRNSANELMHIINETRITAGVLYETRSQTSYNDIAKQFMYSNLRLKKLYEYIDTYPELIDFRKDIEGFDELYTKWINGIETMNSAYTLSEAMSEADAASFKTLADEMRKTGLLAHEILSNTIANIEEIDNNNVIDTRNSNVIAVRTVVSISIVSFFIAIFLAIIIIRSITLPINFMRKTLEQIGQSGNLQIPDDITNRLSAITNGKDETARCTSELLVLIDRMHSIDKTLSFVADGDLTAEISLQSNQDTMGLAVEKMMSNLNQKFGTIALSTNRVHQKAEDLSDGSRLLAQGSKNQADSVDSLLDTVEKVSQKTDQNRTLAKQAADLSNNIQKNANDGAENMNQMLQAVMEINEAGQSISKVIKVIDDIAFQTNILALNAAVEAARAGQHGRGFAVVAEEVRNLSAKSAEAAKDTGTLIEDTVKKAVLGASIAEVTSASFEEIVKGVNQSSVIIGNMADYFNEQASDIQQILTDAKQVEQIVEQNNTIAAQSAEASGEISEQSNLLKELVSQFRLLSR